MPEFSLRYKIPAQADTDVEVEKIRLQALEIANQVQVLASTIFFDWEVGYEVEPFSSDTSNQSDFALTGWVTDNEDKLIKTVMRAQAEISVLMQGLAYEDQTVSCWWQRVKGKWSSASGHKTRL